MKNTGIFCSALIAIFFASCGSQPPSNVSQDEDQWVNVEATNFSIVLPDYMSAMDPTINPDALISYGNAAREIYTMVIEEEVSLVESAFKEANETNYLNGLAGYAAFVRDNLESEFGELKKLAPLKEEKTQDRIGYLCEAEGTSDSVDLCRLIKVIEVNGNYYQFHTWTILNQKDQNLETMHAILQSIHPKVLN